MYLFFMLLVPAAFAYYIAGSDNRDLVGNALPFCAGLVAGIVAVLVDRCVLFFFPALPTSFFLKLTMIVLSDTVVPFILGNAALFFLFESGMKQRLSRLRQQSFGIASIYLPYIMIQQYNVPDMWAVVMIPVMLISVLFLADFYTGKIVASPARSVDTQDIILSYAPVVGTMLVADITKTLWYFRYPSWIFLPLSLLVTAFAFALRLAKYRK
jgi:hypothetical protein